MDLGDRLSHLVLDLEIKYSPIERGWDAARRGECGISAVCAFNSETGRFYLYDDHNLGDLLDHMQSVDTIVTFNGQDFDLPCLEGVVGEPLQPYVHSSYDILQEIWAALGTRRKGYRLDDVCRRTLGIGKDSSGAYATELFATCHFAELFTYCMHDVDLTQTLFEHIMDQGYIIDVNGDKLMLGESNGGELSAGQAGG